MSNINDLPNAAQLRREMAANEKGVEKEAETQIFKAITYYREGKKPIYEFHYHSYLPASITKKLVDKGYVVKEIEDSEELFHYTISW